MWGYHSKTMNLVLIYFLEFVHNYCSESFQSHSRGKKWFAMSICQKRVHKKHTRNFIWMIIKIILWKFLMNVFNIFRVQCVLHFFVRGRDRTQGLIHDKQASTLPLSYISSLHLNKEKEALINCWNLVVKVCSPSM
jgi:hypothetical protein